MGFWESAREEPDWLAVVKAVVEPAEGVEPSDELAAEILA